MQLANLWEVKYCWAPITGFIYELTEEKEQLDELRKNRMESNKRTRYEEEDRLKNYWDITKERHEQLKLKKKKDNKTKDEYCEMMKYNIKQRYQVENVPLWFIRAIKNKGRQYANINRFKKING